MQRTMSYSVGGRIFDLPEDQVSGFLETAKQNGDAPEEAYSYRVSGKGKEPRDFTIPRGQYEQFKATADSQGDTVTPLRTVTLSNGRQRSMTMEEMADFFDSDEYRKVEAGAPRKTDGSFSDDLNASGGGAIGRTVGNLVAGIPRFFGQLMRNAAYASPLGASGESIAKTAPNEVNAALANNPADKAGNWVDGWTKVLFPEVEGDNLAQKASGKVADIGAGLAEFGIMASNPVALSAMVASSAGNSAYETYDAAIERGLSPEEANMRANARGIIDGGMTLAFAKAPIKRLANALGLKTPQIANPVVNEVSKAVGDEAKASVSKGIAKAMAVEAGKAGIEMGLLGGVQAFFDSAIQQEAETGEIDWTEAAKSAAAAGGEQAAMGAFLGMVPTPVRIAQARKSIADGMARSAKTKSGAALYEDANPWGADAIIKAYDETGAVSRKVAAEADLPDMSAKERVRVAELLKEVRADKVAEEEAARTKAADIQTKAANEEHAGRQRDIEEAFQRDASIRGQQERAKRKAEMEEYERAERERIAREKAEQDAQMAEDERARAGEIIASGAEANVPIRQSSEYKSWLRKHGRTDTDKNFNRYVAERGLDASLKVERGHNGPNEETKAELEMGRRIEAEGETQRKAAADKAQADYDEKMTRREEAKAKAARAAKEKQVADDWAAAEADRKAKAQEASRKGQEERARRKAEMAEYEFAEEIRKAQEAAEERGGKPSISVGEGEVVPPSAESRMKDYPEYASWIKKRGRVNNDKNWNKWVLSNGLDPRLTVERNNNPKNFTKPTPPELRVEKPKKPVIEADLSKKTAQVDSKTPENGEIGAGKPENRGEVDRRELRHSAHLDIYTPGDAPGGVEGARIALRVSGKTGEKQFTIELNNGESIDVGPVGSNGKFGIRKGDNIRGPFDTLGKAVQKANELYGGEKQPAKVPDGRGRMVEKPQTEQPSQPLENAPSRAPQEKGTTSQADGAEGKEARNGANGKTIREMSRKELTQKAQSLLNEVRKAMEGDDQSALESANKAYHDFIDGVREDGRFTRFESIDNGDIIANRVTFTDKPTDADYKAYLKKNGKRDSKKARNGFERAWNKEHREPFATESESPSPRVPDGKGRMVKKPEPTSKKSSAVANPEAETKSPAPTAITAEALRDRAKTDPEMIRLDEAQKKAKTTEERNAIMAKLKDRVEELRKEMEAGAKGTKTDGDVKDGRPIFQIDTETPAQKLADPDFRTWAQKQGRTPTDGARRIYDAQRVDAAFSAARNWLKGVTMRRTENAAEVPNGARMLYSRDGNVVGWYDRAKKEVVTLPGADAATVAHELGWHATYDYAQTEAAQGRTAILDKLTEYANNAPQSVKNEILRKYGMATDAATLLDEIGAARYTMDNINKIKDAVDRRQAAKWYQRTWNAIADTYKAMLSKMGWNKARLDNLSALTPEQTVNLLADEMLKGRTLGKAKSSQIDMNAKESLAQLHDRKLKDRLRPIEEIEKDAGKSVENSAHTLFKLLPGKVQGAINKAQNFADKIKADCKKAGIKIDELNEFLYASAASERNAKVLARNGRLDGSAMSHADIQRILSAYRNSPKYAELRRIADDVLAFQRKGFDFRRKAGLISDETWNTLLAEEPNHVPMKSRFNSDGEHAGFDLKEQFGRPEWKTAEGRTNVGDGPLEWIVQEYVDAFSRGNENNARRSLLSTVLAHPEIGSVRKLDNGDALGEIRAKGQQGDPNVFVVKTDGETYQVKLNGTRGELIARAVSGRGLVRAPQMAQKAMRWWSSTATSWSPTFAARNFLADTADVFAVNLGEHGLVKGTAAFGKHVYTALKLTNAIRKYAATGETTNPLIREAVDAGVLMGGGVRGQAFADAGEAALKTLKTDWGNGKNRVKAVRNAMFGWVDTLNQTAELMNRMADYKLQREAGKSKNEAALHAREITVDFNEKGEVTPVTNLLYMFSNSTLGATMRLNKAIFASPEGKSLAAGMFALGIIEGVSEAMANGDDEDGKNMNEYTRANSFYFRKGKDIYRIPLHASPISVIKYAGNCAARKLFGTLNGDKAAEQVAKDAIGIMTSYLGIGALGDNEAASIAPTIVQPFIQAYMNRDFADRPIERTSFTEAKPKSDNGRPSTPQFYKDLARWLNEKGGGSDSRKGSLFGVNADFSPEMLKHFAEATGKNALRDVENTVELARMILGDTEWDRRNIPVARDYYRTTSGNDNRFFEAQRKFKADVYDLDHHGEWRPGERGEFIKSHPWLRKGADSKRTVDRLINRTNKDNPRSGIATMGIDQLRKLTEGKVRTKDGSYIEPTNPISDELKEKAREMLQKRQARVIEIMGL